MHTIEMTGQRFGKLIVLERAGSIHGGKAAWLCRCDCGTEKVISGGELRNANQSSCGCSQAAHSADVRRRHGKSKTPLYRLWRNMINRCERPQTHNYHRYGGRGIAVCYEWRNDSAVFIAWCEANGYRVGLELDRRDNGRGYSPDNCRFVTRLENARNRG